MLNHAGKKIVFWSQILLIAGIAISVVMGIAVIWRGFNADVLRYTVYHNSYLYKAGMLGGVRVVVSGILVMLLGSLGSWLTALLLRAFGDMAEDTRAIRERLEAVPVAMRADAPVAEPEAPAAPEALAEVETPKPANGE